MKSLLNYRIFQRLWLELERRKENSAEYETLIEKIRTLSTEYQVPVEKQGRKPQKTKLSHYRFRCPLDSATIPARYSVPTTVPP
jgi:hypothetical protein